MSVALLLGICMAGFVYYDSGKRDVSMGARAAWTAAGFLLGIIGLIPYFLFGRKKKKEEPVLLEDGAIDVTEDTAVSGVCVACGAKIPVDSKYCLHCGRKQDGMEKEVHETVPTHNGTCPWCGGTIPAEAEYCIHCGRKI
ncbi:MAG: zinc ribbon domain-containing protein [Selenomonadales bacterium]|nr:zinc ribbon domain-containing protein [Selenomonadales bacterium]